MPEGHAAPRRVGLLPDAHTPNERRWRDQHTTVRRVESSLQDALLAVDDEDIWMRDYLRSWGAQVGRLDLGEVPTNIRGNSPALYGRLANTYLPFRELPALRP